MSDIQKIIDNLCRLRDDKKNVLSKRQQDHSEWLRGQFEQIKSIVVQNPRDHLSCASSSSSASAAPTSDEHTDIFTDKSITEPSSIEEDVSKSQKRKSPEFAIGSSRDSPEQKRNSSDYLTLAVQAGLPSDLNKLKKEQLLAELEARGNLCFSMKSLKPALIEALKEALITESKIVNGAVHETDDMISESPDKYSNQPTSPLVPRTGSLMEIRRSLATQSQISSENETEESRKARLEVEFAARQQRHRDSQLRKSLNGQVDLPEAAGSVELETDALDVTCMQMSPLKSESIISGDPQDTEEVDESASTAEFHDTQIVMESQDDRDDVETDAYQCSVVDADTETEAKQSSQEEVGTLSQEFDDADHEIDAANQASKQEDEEDQVVIPSSELIEDEINASSAVAAEEMGLELEEGEELEGAANEVSGEGSPILIAAGAKSSPSTCDSTGEERTDPVAQSAIATSTVTAVSAVASAPYASPTPALRIDHASRDVAPKSEIKSAPASSTAAIGFGSPAFKESAKASSAVSAAVAAPANTAATAAAPVGTASAAVALPEQPKTNKGMTQKLGNLISGVSSFIESKTTSAAAPAAAPKVAALERARMAREAEEKKKAEKEAEKARAAEERKQREQAKKAGPAAGSASSAAGAAAGSAGGVGTTVAKKGITHGISKMLGMTSKSTKPAKADIAVPPPVLAAAAAPAAASTIPSASSAKTAVPFGVKPVTVIPPESPAQLAAPSSASSSSGGPSRVASTAGTSAASAGPTSGAVTTVPFGRGSMAFSAAATAAAAAAPSKPATNVIPNFSASHQISAPATSAAAPTTLVAAVDSSNATSSSSSQSHLFTTTAVATQQSVPSQQQQQQQQPNAFKAAAAQAAASFQSQQPFAPPADLPQQQQHQQPSASSKSSLLAAQPATVLSELSVSAVSSAGASSYADDEDDDDDDDAEENPGYEINSDRDSSGSSIESGTDDEEEQERRQNSIPAWARGAALKEALERQYGLHQGHPAMDPDLIFPEVVTCSLEEIFGCKEGKSGVYAKRTSSAKWDQDELTMHEKRSYRNHMGYGGMTPSKPISRPIGRA